MLNGSRVLVTGGSSGIGRAIAHAVASEGASVVITGRDRQRLDEVAAASDRIEAVICDVTDDAAIAALQRQLEASGGIDMLINCAGVMHFFDVTSGYPLERQLREIDIDVSGPVRMVGAFLPGLLQRQSTIVNVSSGLAWVPYAAAPVYSGAKAFVHAWTVALREQLKDTSGAGRRTAATRHRHPTRRRAEPELQAHAGRRRRGLGARPVATAADIAPGTSGAAGSPVTP